MTTQPILVVLGDRTASEILETARLAHGDRFSSLEKCYFSPQTFTREVVPRLSSSGNEIFFHAGVAAAELKQRIVEACVGVGWRAFTVVHPTAVIAPSARLGEGVFVGPLAVVSSHAEIGDYSMVHIHASIGHDCRIGRFAAILPGARISGNVRMGDRVLVGSNAFVAAGRALADDVRVDALTYVHQDVPAGYLVSPRFPKALRRVDLRRDQRPGDVPS